MQKSTRIIIEQKDLFNNKIVFDNPQFVININIFNSGWAAGLPGTLHYSSIFDVFGGKYQEDYWSKYSTIHFQTKIDYNFEFPESGLLQFEEVKNYVNLIVRLIEENFDIKYLHKNISLAGKIYSIDLKLKLILDKLGIEEL